MVLEAADNAAVTGNVVNDFTTGVQLYATSAVTFDNVVVSGNSFSSNGTDYAQTLSGGAAVASTVRADVQSFAQTYTATNVSTDRSYDADSTSTAELADVLGTLIADLRRLGLVL